MSFFNFIDRVIRQQSNPPATFTITEDNLLDGWEEGVERFFQPQASYFEIRLKQMYLRNQREYWREFRPFSTFVTAFVHGGGRREVPFVVGPELLGAQTTAVGGDAVEYRNLRIAGPFPYEGDDLQLFSALSRMTAKNWAVQSLSLLETVAKAFDVSKITRYLEIAAPLVKGIESFLSMADVELRMGMQQVYQQPVGRGGLRPNALRARHEVLLNVPDHQAVSEQFWLKEGKLFYGNSADAIRPYRDADFMLFEIRPLRERGDYTTFDFHTVGWQDTRKAVWDGSEEMARQKLRLMAGMLVQCADILRPQRIALLRKYKREFDEELALFQEFQLEPAFRSPRKLAEKQAERSEALTEVALGAALEAEPVDPSMSLEQALAEVGL